MDRERLLERFLRYVKIDTTACEDTENYPSSLGQLELGKVLLEELIAMGATQPAQDEHGIVTATILSTAGDNRPTVALCAHLDTSPETTGKNVQPQVVRDYAGGDIALPGSEDLIIRTSECPELDSLHGCNLITTDGTTLLGGDDKAGIAVIMETAAYLLEHGELPHGELRLCFTCDEEIGRGVDHIDVPGLNADVCYTLDGQGTGELDVETFSADLAVVRIGGVNIHPAIAQGKMVNAITIAGEFLAQTPKEGLSPETTSDREGFLHPYSIEGGVSETTIRIILRSFDADQLTEYANMLRELATKIASDHNGCTAEVEIRRQYRNMAEGLQSEPRAVAFAEQAYQQLDRPCQKTIVRGGTDGSVLTEKGLPTPNLSTGQHNIHSPLEWACLDEMVEAAEHLIALTQIWAEETSS